MGHRTLKAERVEQKKALGRKVLLNSSFKGEERIWLEGCITS
jgi:hypothetical protein